MSSRPHNTCPIAAGAVLAAVLTVFFSGVDNGVGAQRSLRDLARAREMAERASRTGAVRAAGRKASPIVSAPPVRRSPGGFAVSDRGFIGSRWSGQA